MRAWIVAMLPLLLAGGGACASGKLQGAGIYSSLATIDVANPVMPDTAASVSEEAFWAEMLRTVPVAAQVKTSRIDVVHITNAHVRDSIGGIWGNEKTDYQVPGAVVSGYLGQAKRIQFFIDRQQAPSLLADELSYWSWLVTHEFGHVLDPREFKTALPRSAQRLDSIRTEFARECVVSKPNTDSRYLTSLRAKQNAGRLTWNEVLEECIADRIGAYLDSCPSDSVGRDAIVQKQFEIAGAYLAWLEEALGYGRFDFCQAHSRRFSLLVRHYDRLGMLSS